MKHEPIISVIVPVYNVEKYLDKCIESIIDQTYKNLEILLIDDGSTDNSGKMCDEWGKKEKRIKVYHKKNGGLSDARNYAILKAKGEYLSFIDSDDWIEKNMYEKLISGCIKNNKDIGCCNRVRVYEQYSKNETIIDKDEKNVNKNDFLSIIMLNFDTSVCNKIFRKKLFDKISFPKGKIYEDIATLPYLVDISNGAYCNNLYGYFYRQNTSSISHNRFNIKKFDYYYHLKNFRNFITNKHSNLKEENDSFHILSLSSILSDIYNSRKEYKKEYTLVLNEMSSIEYKNNKYIPKLKKIMLFLELHHLTWLAIIIKKLRR